MTVDHAARPAQTILAGQARHPCGCVTEHSPPAPELERHHVHPEALQRAQGLRTWPLTDAAEWHAGQGGAALLDERAAYWVALCPTTHSAVHVLLRRYQALGGGPLPREALRGSNRLARRLAAEGNRRVLAHGGWPA